MPIVQERIQRRGQLPGRSLHTVIRGFHRSRLEIGSLPITCSLRSEETTLGLEEALRTVNDLRIGTKTLRLEVFAAAGAVTDPKSSD